MKTPSVTKLLLKTSQIFETLTNIQRRIDEGQRRSLMVEFYHKADLSLSFTKWNDQWQPYDGKGNTFIYTYEITSKGINFYSFEEKNPNDNSWQPSVRFWSFAYQKNCSLLSIPNKGPIEGQSMYIFHQERIRETLSALPVWSIEVIQS